MSYRDSAGGSAAKWTSSVGSQPTTPAATTAAPLGQITVTVYGWKLGQSQVQVGFPDDGKPGISGYEQVQNAFVALAINELKSAVAVLQTLG